jgi:DNA-binding transcriptional LysR family regulator
MELRHLEYFVAVAEERSFTRAAARLHVVQSGVSAAIKTLERELGTPLLERTSKRVVLTDAGVVLLPRARATLDAARAARDAVDEVRGGLRGTLRMGTLNSVGVVDLPALLGAFHREHPLVNLRLMVSPRGTDGLVEALLDGRLDVSLVSVPGRVPAGIHVRQFFSEKLALVLPRGHPLADREVVSIAELAEERFVDFPVGFGNRLVVDRAFAAAGIERQVSLEVIDVTAGARFVAHGLGVAIMMPFAVSPELDVVIRPLAEGGLDWPMGVATSSLRAPSAAARALLALIDDYLLSS